LELVREFISPSTAVALLINPDRQTAEVARVQKAAQEIGHDLVVVHVRGERDFGTAFAQLANTRVGVLLVADDAIFMNRREQVVALATQHKIPAMYGRSEYPAAGGLMSYGASTPDQYRQAGVYVGRILKGDKPGDLPFLQPSKFELIVNLKAARGLGREVPAKLLGLADHVIE
jgi:putative ABC transport system substrate-binding protein